MSIPVPQILKDAWSGTTKHHKRVTIIGVRQSAKTTALGCLDLTCNIKSLRDKNFVAYIDEKTSGILRVSSDLCQGYFPPATESGSLYEADLIMKWKTRFGEKTVVLPFCETAGEDMEKLIGPFAQKVYLKNPSWVQDSNLYKQIGDSNGYVVVIPVNRALMFQGKGYEPEPSNLAPDPDVNLRRILAAIFRYKRHIRSSAKIEGIAVLLTKYDWIDAFAKNTGMDLNDPVGARQFMHTYFRQTSTALKYYGMERVRFFPVFVQVKREKLPDGSTRFVTHEDKSRGYRIELADEHPNMFPNQPLLNLPVYSQEAYENLIDWIKETFAN